MSTPNTPSEARLHPLLADACRCLTLGPLRCTACERWARHYTALMLRNAAKSVGST